MSVNKFNQSRMSASKMSNKSGAMSTTSNGYNPNHRNVRQPMIPSNLDGEIHN